MPNPTLKLSPSQHKTFGHWAKLWHTPSILDFVAIEFSPRLTRSLGRVRPATGIIRLNTRLQNAPREFLLEVLCHEAAHVAAYLAYGAGIQPHGPEWRDLVRRAGYEPNTKIADCLPPQQKGHSPKDVATAPSLAKRRYHYRCPICQQDYSVRRRSSNLFCTLCETAGNPVSLLFQAPKPLR
jgi:predicted SprT family Zn-dependent metalloprotease